MPDLAGGKAPRKNLHPLTSSSIHAVHPNCLDCLSENHEFYLFPVLALNPLSAHYLLLPIMLVTASDFFSGSYLNS